MKHKTVSSKLNTYTTYLLYRDQFTALAENVFVYENMPDSINIDYFNKILTEKGSIAFFFDEVLGKYFAFPYIHIGKLDYQNQPLKIQVLGENGYRRVLNQNEFVIIYDNNLHISLLSHIRQYAERYTNIVRTIDVNIYQQKTPRVWKVPQNKEKTFYDMLNSYDSFEDNIITYTDKANPFEDVQCESKPVTYVADKLIDAKRELWSEFMRFIGVADLSFNKKERNIRDEVLINQGGAVISRYSRYTPRIDAIKKINELFNLDIKVKYYDGTPSNDEKDDESNFVEGADSDVYTNDI